MSTDTTNEDDSRDYSEELNEHLTAISACAERIISHQDMIREMPISFEKPKKTSTEGECNVDDLFERSETKVFVDDQNGIWVRVSGYEQQKFDEVKLRTHLTSRGPLTIQNIGGGKTVVRIFDFPADGLKI